MNCLYIIDIISVFISAISVCIAAGALHQNSKMIENSSCPYLTVYGAATHVGSSNYYLILKNFGQSSATITSFTYDIDLKNFALFSADEEPFSQIDGTTILPGQAFKAAIDYDSAVAQTKEINFSIEYSAGVKKYQDHICLNLLANSGNYVWLDSTAGKELLCISEALQELNQRSL